MTVYTQTLTFSTSAVQITPASMQPSAAKLPPSGTVHRIYVEPLASNTATCYVGVSSVTNDGSGTGVISELPKPALTAVERPTYWELISAPGMNSIDPLQYYFHGTSGDKVKVTLFVM